MNYMHNKNVFLALLKKESRELLKAPIILIVTAIATLCNLYINFFYDGNTLSVSFIEKQQISLMLISLVIIIQYLNDSTLNDIETGGIIFLLNIGSSLRKLFFVKVMFGVFIGFCITGLGMFRNDSNTFLNICSIILLFYNVGIICIIVSSLCGKDRTIQWFITSFLAISYYLVLLKINNILKIFSLHVLVFIVTQLIFLTCINSSNFRKKLK